MRLTLYRQTVDEVRLHNAGVNGVDVELPRDAEVVSIEKTTYGWEITYSVVFGR